MPPKYKRNDVDQCQGQIDLHVTITQHGSVIYTCSSQFLQGTLESQCAD